MSILYHLGKDNVVAYPLSRMFIGSVSHIEDEKKELDNDIDRLARLGVQLIDFPKGGFTVQHISDSSLVVDVKSKQHLEPILIELKEFVLKKFFDSPNGEMGYLDIMVGCIFRMWTT